MLKITDLCRNYRGCKAVQNLNLEIETGKTCLLLGPNGSGKTTLMKLIAGLTRPSAGSILLDGEPINARTKARIAYMPTENFFYNYMCVRDAGRYYADFFKDFNRDRFEGMIRDAELPADRRIRTLSSGMSAKLRLALTLSREAELMMFDEPINGVDLITRDWVVSAIAAHRAPNRTLLISTHLVEEVENLADGVIFMKTGELVRAGAMDEVCREKRPEDLYREIYGAQSVEEEKQNA